MPIVVHVESAEKEFVDFVGYTPPEQVGPNTTPKLTVSDHPAVFRVLSWNNPSPPTMGRRGQILQPEYNFVEIGKATDTDGILRAARDKQLVALLKERWWVGGKNPRTVAYVQRRINEISRMSQMTFAMLLRTCASDLIEYGNFFLYLHRDIALSSGKETVVADKQVDPIAAIHPLDVTTMRPKVGETVDVKAWYQSLDRSFTALSSFRAVDLESTSNTKRYSTEDVVHGFTWRRAGFIFGTPPSIPVLDDVRALRRLEEISELVAHRHAFPLVHVAVGTESQPMRVLVDGSYEIDKVKDAYEEMKLEGAFITSERVAVDAITTKPLDLSNLLEHFTRRVITGLGLSEIDLGRGNSANRGTANVLSRTLMDRCRELQQVLSDTITNQILDILLTEGGFEINPENRVYLKFPEVDIDRTTVLGNFAVDLYAKNAITEDEMREMLGRDPLTPAQRKIMYWELIEKPKALIQAVDEPFSSAAIAAKNKPTNQNGTKLAKTTPANDHMSKIITHLNTLRDALFCYVSERISESRSIDDRQLWQLVEWTYKAVADHLLVSTDSSIHAGFEAYTEEIQSDRSFVYTGSLRRRFSKHCIEPLLDRFFGTQEEPGEIGELIRKIRTCSDGKYLIKIVSYFDTWGESWERCCVELEKVAKNFGLAQATWIDGIHNVGWDFGSSFRRLGPAQAAYCELRDNNKGKFCIVKSDESNYGITVSKVDLFPSSCVLKLYANSDSLLDITKAGRSARIVFDSGDQILIPDELNNGYNFDRSGLVHLPRKESGTIEVWDNGKVIGKTRFVVPQEQGE